ncbi:hypothetical protein MK852_06750 [Shewanella benthica]|uniref:hypothetical protein n=1 Tax=Shewanella benthica TaxID=43661 RepID=UPI00187A1857|nr:hypothetical protein [Shewanella benthica]MBE7213930.1 hypothetical protein [Shewanella benthica]MCL1061836.1 hypothetical protein [Shewanella benthica]
MLSKLQNSLSFIFVLACSTANASDVPNVFSASTSAKAGEVNENFDYLNVRANDFEEQLEMLQLKSMGNHLIDGEQSVEVDCSGNPAALNEAYAENVQYRNLNFTITGNCYGDIRVIRTFDENNVWTNDSFQPGGQTLNIFGAEGGNAHLIPNDLSGSVTIWGGFGGGLYLGNLTIQMGNSTLAAAYSRNGQGGLTNVIIEGPGEESADWSAGVWLQEGAQAYLSNLTVSGVNVGVYARNSAVVRFLGDENSISASDIGIYIFSSDVAQQAKLITSSIDISSGSRWLQAGKGSTTADTVNIREGSSLVVNGAMNLSNGLWVELSQASIRGEFTSPFVNVSQGQLFLDGGHIADVFEITDAGNANVSNSSINVLNMYRGAKLNIRNSTIGGNAHIAEDASVFLTEVTFEGDQFKVLSSKAYFWGMNDTLTDKLFCHGLSFVEFPGVDLVTAAPASNCLDFEASNTLMNLIKSNHGS